MVVLYSQHTIALFGSHGKSTGKIIDVFYVFTLSRLSLAITTNRIYYRFGD